jgi:L-serine dehydratase
VSNDIIYVKVVFMLQAFDIIGPVMIGPSSSHTAGACRIGKAARRILGAVPSVAEVHLSGSFAKTYRGHGTDKAIIGGILGMEPDDMRIRTSFDIAKEQGLSFSFIETEIENSHPNTALIHLKSEGQDADSAKSISLQGESIGGGNILIKKINGTAVSISGKSDTLIITHNDVPGVIALVSNILTLNHININGFSLYRDHKGGTAIMVIEVDGVIGESVGQLVLHQDHILDFSILKAI